MTKWEYMVLEIPFGMPANEGLNQLGDDGWEAVSMVQEPSMDGPSLIVLLKRQRRDHGEPPGTVRLRGI
jgi:hypothetical protein